MENKILKSSDILYQDILSKIDGLKKKKNIYNILYRSTKVVVILIGASITTVSGWQIAGSGSFTIFSFTPENYILLSSAILTVLAAFEGLFNFRDKGKSYDLFLFELRRLRDKISFDYMKGTEIYEKNKESNFQNFQTIMASQKTIIEDSFSDDE